MPWKIMSIGLRDWAHRFSSERLGRDAGGKPFPLFIIPL
jgi:hypothetical protein